MTAYQFETWDVFTSERFRGNPLAVVYDADPLSTDDMQTIAREFNLSETVFVRSPVEENNAASLRIFTPGSELPFAGHPTIGAAHAIARRRGDKGAFVLELSAGAFDITFDGDRAQFVNPNPPEARPAEIAIADIAAALGLGESDLLAAPMIAGAPTPFLTVEVAYDALSRMVPDMGAIAKLSDEIYLIAGSPGADDTFRTRMFAPAIGIPEDPATGSAACALPAYVAATSRLDDANFSWTIEQGVEMGRRSLIQVSFGVASGTVGKVAVAGEAIAMQRGEISF